MAHLFFASIIPLKKSLNETYLALLPELEQKLDKVVPLGACRKTMLESVPDDSEEEVVKSLVDRPDLHLEEEVGEGESERPQENILQARAEDLLASLAELAVWVVHRGRFKTEDARTCKTKYCLGQSSNHC